MRRFVSTAALFGALSMAALAESYSGKLLDAPCYDQQKQAIACDATPANDLSAAENADLSSG